MTWSQLDVNKPHLVYIVLGGFTTLFMLCSSVIKERFYIGEATIATLCGIIFGPHAANLVDPGTWGNTDQVTLEFSRVILVVQCFAVGVELPKAYMERHWRSVVFLLVPVMTFGWLMTSLFIWAVLSSHLNWLASLTCAACVTATDPVLASSVVGKGKFAKRVPKHLRDLLSAESGCNDGMAFPFAYLAVYLVRYRPDANQVSLNWFCVTILYECIFGAIFGVTVGYLARRGIRYAHDRDLIDRESFLVFYFVLALFCAGAGSILGIDDLLVGFACGVGFSNDGWFTEKTEESHVSNVIDLLLNLAFFVYFGTIIPWDQYNSEALGTSPWRLVVIALLVLFFRRIPIMMALKPVIPDIKTWREALFAGHFGPIGVGAIFVAILVRAEFETESTQPLAVIPDTLEHLNIIRLIWPITTFLVLTSIIVHGSSIAVFTLGKHINTLTITMSYTQANEEGYSWMERLPRIQSRSRTSMSGRQDSDGEDLEKMPAYPAAALGLPRNFLRRQKEEDGPKRMKASRRQSGWDEGMGPGGPVTQSAIRPMPRKQDSTSSPEMASSVSDGELKSDSSPESLSEKKDFGKKTTSQETPQDEKMRDEIYQEGDHTVIEDGEGNVLEVMSSKDETAKERDEHAKDEAIKLMEDDQIERRESRKEEERQSEPAGLLERARSHLGQARNDNAGGEPQGQGQGRLGLLRRMTTLTGMRSGEGETRPEKRAPEPKLKEPAERRHGPARAFRFGRTIIVEDEDGEVIKKYEIPVPERNKLDAKQAGGLSSYVDSDRTRQRLQRMGKMLGVGGGDPSADVGGVPKPDDADDAGIRFTMQGNTRRMSKADFIKQIQSLDPKSRAEVVEESTAPEVVKEEARADAKDYTAAKRRASRAEPEGSTIAEITDTAAVVEQRAPDDAGRAAGDDDLTLIDSKKREIPFHSVHSDLRNSIGPTETPAQHRRRVAAATAAAPLPPRRTADPTSDSDDDGTERVPPRGAARVRSSSDSDGAGERERERNREDTSDGEAETAAERRRREGALGITAPEPDSDSDSDVPPHQTRSPGIRFADQDSRPTEEGRQSTPSAQRASGLRWAVEQRRRH